MNVLESPAKMANASQQVSSDMKEQIETVVEQSRKKQRDPLTSPRPDEEDVFRNAYVKHLTEAQKKKELNIERNEPARQKLANILLTSLHPEKATSVIEDQPFEEVRELQPLTKRDLLDVVAEAPALPLSKSLAKSGIPLEVSSFDAPELKASSTKSDTRERRVGDFKVTEQVMDSSSLNKILADTKVAFLLHSHDLVTIEHHTSIEAALEILAKHGILSAPVLEKGKVIGMIDVLDLVASVLRLLEKHKRTKTQEKLFSQRPVKRYMNASGMNPWTPVSAFSSIKTVVLGMGLGVHRTAVTNIHGELAGIVSQSDVVRLFSEHKLLLGTRIHSTLSQVGCYIPEGDLVTVPSDTPVMKALKTLLANRVSAVVVIDKEQKVVGFISANQLKAIQYATFHYLLYSCELFLHRLPEALKKVCKLFSTSTLATAVDIFATEKVHRVCVYDRTGAKFLGLITLTDLLRAVMQKESDPKTHIVNVSKEV